MAKRGCTADWAKLKEKALRNSAYEFLKKHAEPVRAKDIYNFLRKDKDMLFELPGFGTYTTSGLFRFVRTERYFSYLLLSDSRFCKHKDSNNSLAFSIK